jgi:hypothetical protein
MDENMTDTTHGANEPVNRTDEDREFAAITDSEIWEEAKDRLQIAVEAYTDNRKRAKAAMLFREGEQWDNDTVTTVSEDSPELTINLTDAFVRRVVNNIKQQRPRGKCHPVGDGANVDLAEIINGIGRHVEMRSEADIAYDLASERAVDAGEGYFRLISEYESPRSFRKDLRILPIRNIFSVHMDPGAIMPSGADQNWCIISTLMKRQEYKRRYPKAKNVNWNDIDHSGVRLEWESKEHVRLAEYFRIREKPETLYQIVDKQGQEHMLYQSELKRITGSVVALKDAVDALTAAGARIISERQSIKRQVEWFRLNGLQVVERQEIPGQYIPVFRVDGNAIDIDGRVRRRGMVDAMMDPQRMVNYGEVAKIKRLGLAPKAPWIAAEGQLDGHPEWDDANQKAYSVLTYKPIVIETGSVPIMIPPPQRQAPAQIEAGFSEFVQGMRSNLVAVAGMPNEPGQDQQGGVVVSGKAIDRRQWLSDQSHFQYYDHTVQAIAQCWRVILEWIPVYFSEPGRMQRIIGEDSTPQMVALNAQDPDSGDNRLKNDLSVGRYDVVMDTGPGYDTKREEGAENMIELLKIPALAEIIAKTAPDLVFRSIDHPYMQELADRLMAANPEGLKKIMDGMSSRARSVIQALANENTAIKQQLQAAQLEVKQGLQKAHLNAVVKAHDTETRADTAIKVEEIRAGGKIIDARADRDHSAAQFADQIEHEASMAMASMHNDNLNAAADRAAAQQQQSQPGEQQ